MSYRLCFPVKRSKGEVFADLNLKQFCVEVPELVVTPIDPAAGPRPEPWKQIGALTTIVELTALLPERLAMRDELRNLATRALEAAVADLGDDVTLHHDRPRATTIG
jgi:hypothetical protein